jgi:hypothetical protein
VDQVNFNDAIEKIKRIGFAEKEDTFRSDELCMLVKAKHNYDVAVQLVMDQSLKSFYVFETFSDPKQTL